MTIHIIKPPDLSAVAGPVVPRDAGGPTSPASPKWGLVINDTVKGVVSRAIRSTTKARTCVTQKFEGDMTFSLVGVDFNPLHSLPASTYSLIEKTSKFTCQDMGKPCVWA